MTSNGILAHDAIQFQPSCILLTGGAGFIGSQVVKHFLNNHSYDIIVFDKFEYCANRRNLDLDPDVQRLGRLTIIEGDICDQKQLHQVFDTHPIDTVLHFAALTHVDKSFNNSFAFTHNNVVGTHVLLDVIKDHAAAVKRIIHVSTDEVYGETRPGNDRQFLEHESPLNPTNPYSASKAAAEMIVKGFIKSYNLPIIVTRGNNVYGPCQHPEKLISKLIYRGLLGKSLQLHGDGSQLRGYVHVHDVARAFDLLTHRGEPGQIYNIGTRSELSVLQVATDICQSLGLDAEKRIEYVKDRLFQDRRYLIDNRNLEELGWQPRLSWMEGLKQTIEWHRTHVDYWSEMDDALQAHYDADGVTQKV
eukprot:TRINITY_DN12531_c5_g1_i3.p1 TRINITY_DN12531_c5_g1~~TRINITY_DN12531_c5_g1_i3.p1  ORF type:complete len:361 (+),score=57.74 TRINITY_DN12531_c5_g1_i3:139-1221(+)